MGELLGRGAEHRAQTRRRIRLSQDYDIRADASCLTDDLTPRVSHRGPLIGLVEVAGKLPREPCEVRLHLAQAGALCCGVGRTLSHVDEPQAVSGESRRAEVGGDICVGCLEGGGVENGHALLVGGGTIVLVHEHRQIGQPDDVLGGASEDAPLNPGLPLPGKDDEVGLLLFGRTDDLIGGRTVSNEDTRLEPARRGLVGPPLSRFSARPAAATPNSTTWRKAIFRVPKSER